MIKNLLRLIIAVYFMKRKVDNFQGGPYRIFMVYAHESLCAADSILLNLTPERNKLRCDMLEDQDGSL